jgi:hypothetical protein
VILDVTPLQQLDGPPPVAVTLDSFEVRDGSSRQQWTLPEPVRVRGTIRNGLSVVEADVTLTAKQTMLGLPPKIVMASVAGTIEQDSAAHDFELWVGGEGEYTLRVQPKDTNLPPVTKDLEIIRGEPIEVNYADAELDVQHTFMFAGKVEDRPLVVRAFDVATGALISSTAEVLNKQATLRFAADHEEFRLVVRAADAYDPEGLSSPEGCDHDTPVLPTFSINLSKTSLEGGVFLVEVPSAPPRVLFSGRVKICDAPSVDGTMEPERLPITLRSTAVMIDDPTGKWSAEIATDTEARPDEDSPGQYLFCVDVFQGEYEVVVTPPESKPCEIFAQSLPILTGNGVTASAPELKMANAAQLLGELRTADMMPLAATTVDVQSLGRSIPLDAPDGALTAFSRSRQTTTDATGAFSLPVDRGSYDVTIKPPPGSGYAWYVRRDVTIGRNEPFVNDIDMSSPVAVDCELNPANGETLTGTEVTAYSVVVGDDMVERAVAIGKAVADENGRFMLLLPPMVYEGWSSSGLP